MYKIAVLVLADSETHGDAGRITNALEIAKEFKEHGDDVQIIFDGAGTTWVGKIANADSKMYPLYASVEDKVQGACSYCAKAFGVKSKIEKAGVPLLGDFDDHPSIRSLVANGYQVMTF